MQNIDPILTVIIANTFETKMSITHLNESRPFIKRTVHIELTEEQAKQLELKKIGTQGGKDAYEEIFECFLELKVEGVEIDVPFPKTGE